LRSVVFLLPHPIDYDTKHVIAVGMRDYGLYNIVVFAWAVIFNIAFVSVFTRFYAVVLCGVTALSDGLL